MREIHEAQNPENEGKADSAESEIAGRYQAGERRLSCFYGPPEGGEQNSDRDHRNGERQRGRQCFE
jgi:hypothetical protein